MSERNWFYAVGQAREGPLAESGLRQLIAAGNLASGTLIWTDGLAQWQPAGSIAEFAPLFRGKGPPPLPATPIGYATPLPTLSGDPLADSAGMRMLLPVGRSGWAIASGYLGLLSVIPFFGLFAIITGIIAILHMRRDPRLHGMGRAIFGIAAGAIGSAAYIAMIFHR
jgi:GYF domain 2